MFLSDTHLPQVLTRDQYRDPKYLDREVERAFLPTWHLIGTTADIPRDGDFRKINILGRELLLWHAGGEHHCYLNVCPHRFCAITDKTSGSSPERLRCQYHGWEFDPSGNTRKIPDAPSFRPLSKGAVGLTQFPVERVGQLLFTTLNPNARPLREFLGPAYDLCLERFGDEWQQVWSYDPETEGNWKGAVEITLEGYHVVATHEKTLGKYPMPDEQFVTHEYPDAEHCVFRADHNSDPLPVYNLVRRLSRICGWTPDLTWYHYHSFPHFGCVSSNNHSLAQCVLPIGPRRHVNMHRVFTRKSNRRNLVSRTVAHFVSNSMLNLSRDTLAEDRAMITSHYRGLTAPELPRGGLISRREERVVHFQNYIANLHVMPDDSPAQEAEPTPVAAACRSCGTAAEAPAIQAAT